MQDVPAVPVGSEPIVQGRQLFEAKGCVRCHAVWEAATERHVGPDLGGKGANWRDVADFASGLWNQIPLMSEKMQEMGLERPTISPEEMQKLAAYLFYVKFLGQPGDISRGRLLFEQRSCSRCHQFGGQGGTVGPRLDDLKPYMTSFFMARALWNHGPKMAEKLEEMKLARPQFEPRDVTDMVAFIRGEARPPDALDLAYSQAGNARAGAALFEKRGCNQCHPAAGEGGGMGPDLSEQGPGLDISEIAGTFWNHGPAMWAKMREAGVPFPELSDREMSDILAYLALLQYQGPRGDADRGRKVFDDKACSRCHSPQEQAAQAAKGPALSPAARSALVWAASIWNGAPAMARQLAEADLGWPQLELNEVRDLVEFLHPPEERK